MKTLFKKLAKFICSLVVVYGFTNSLSAQTGSSLNFDGNYTYVNLPDYSSAWDLGNDFTVEMWIKPNTVSGPRLLLYSGFGCFACPEWVMSIGPESTCGGGGTSGHLVFLATGNLIESDNVISTAAWTHIAVTYNGSVMRMYINGAVQSSSVVATFSVHNSQYRYIGGDPSVYYGCYYRYMYDGNMDELRMWKRALCQTEIANNMSCEIPTNSTGLTANYHFNQGTANGLNGSVTTLTDASSTNVTGNLGNFALSGSTSNWVSSSPFTSGTTCTTLTLPDIKIFGNGTYIPLNYSTPTTTNNTEFGNIYLGSVQTRSFLIQNNAAGTLSITSAALSGSGASNFSITTSPAITVAGTSSTSIVITFSPSSLGLKTATFTLISNDCDESPYVITIEGTGTTPASALNFDGVDDCIDVASDPALAVTNAATVEGWFRTTTGSQLQQMFRLDNAIDQGIDVRVDGSGYFDFAVYLGGWHPYTCTSGPIVNDGLWHHFAITVSGNTANAYLDGLFAASVTGTASLNTGDVLLTIGKHPYAGFYFNGDLDEIRVWNVARTQCQIQSYKDCEIPTTASGLVANYHFNQGSSNVDNSGINTLTDAAGVFTGTLNTFLLNGTSSNWISPSHITNGYTVVAIPNSSITVTGNSNPISNNSTTVTTLNSTDFGTATTTTFVIQNSNSGTLNIGAPYLTGLNASEFSITVLPSSTLSTLATTSFVVVFTPATGGIKNCTVNINNNDCAKPVFNFAIQASTPLASALDFDANDDLLRGNLLSTNTSSITMQAKIYYYGATGQNQMIMYNGSFANSGYGLYISNSAPGLSVLFGGVAYTGFNYTLPTNQWTSLTAVVRGSMIECYVNGTLTSLSANPGAGVPTGSFTIGGNYVNSENFNGKMDEVLFWNKALSQCEIQTYLNCEIPTSAPNLLANYHFNQGSNLLANPSESLLIDVSGNSNNLTLLNFSLTGATSNWTSPGAVANGYSITTPPSASISVSGNSNPIANSSTTVSTLNATDFGSSTSQTFVVQNSNSGTLNIGAPYFTGLNTSEFSITVLPASTLPALATTSFVVAFTPTAGGTRVATVNIGNNDCNIPIFNFAVSGVAPPAAALRFDGVDDYVDLPSNNLPTGNSDFTIEFWVKINSAQTFQRWIAWMGSVTSGSMVTFGYDGNNNNRIRVHHLGPDLIANTASITPNVWTHVAVNYRGAAYSNDIFINGTYIETLNFGVPLTLPANGIFQLGTFNSITTYCPDMDLDEFRIWNRALCAAEIQNNMNCEIATTAPGLVANYHFNQGNVNVDNNAVTTLTDVSGSLNTGTLSSGFALTSTVSNWVAPGAVTSGSSCTLYLDPEINILGNSVSIVSGASTPALSDFTDFGSVCSNGNVVRTFSIQNTGVGTLSVNSMSMTGTDAALLTIGPLSPASPIAAGGGASFDVTLTPLTSGVKTATITINNNDCDESAYTFVLSGTSNTLPIVSAATSNSIICNTATTSVTGSGADTYTWNGTIAATNNTSFSPTVTANYSVTGTNTLTGCTSTNNAVLNITVNALPIAVIATPNATICANTTATLIGSGGTNYTWTPGPLNTATINPTLSNTSSYSLTVTDVLTGCTSTNSAIQTINVNQSPTISISVTQPSICTGNTLTLTASNAVNYTWSPGNFTTASITPTLTCTTVYTLIGSSSAGCLSFNTITQTITVYPLPVVTASASNLIICSGNTTSLFGSGALSYTWTGSILNNVTFTPSATNNYTVTGTNANGCQNTASITITVNTTPGLTANIISTVVCSGNSITLSGSGASTYTWSGGIADGIAFLPSSTQVYSLTGTSSAGCTNTNVAVVSVTVNALPSVIASVTNSVVCLGNSSTLNGYGALTYAWTNGAINSVSFSPSLTTIYTVTGEDANGCTNTATVSIAVNNLPTLTVTSTNSLVCQAENATLTVNGAVTYTWNNNQSAPSIWITPTITTSYFVSATDANGCGNSASYTQSVSPCLGTLIAVASKTNVTCSDKNDGKITIASIHTYSNSTLSYVWSANAQCPPNTCNSVDNLAGGTYSVIVRATYTLNNILVKQDSIVIDSIVILNENGPCSLKIFNGVSANGDGINDTWQIENIVEFPKNKVTIFNRWGEKVFEVSGYDNVSKVWPTGTDLQKAGSNTYFYIIDLGDGSKPVKGWIDLNKN